MDSANVMGGVGISNLVRPQAGIRIAENAEAGVVSHGAAVGCIVKDAVHAAREIVVDLQSATGSNRERQTRVDRIDAREFPAAQDATGQGFLFTEPRFFKNAVNA